MTASKLNSAKATGLYWTKRLSALRKCSWLALSAVTIRSIGSIRISILTSAAFSFCTGQITLRIQSWLIWVGSPFVILNPNKNSCCVQQDIGYKDFKRANAEVDQLFIDSILRIVTAKGTPILIAIAGPTAAGKTEIVERLRTAFQENALPGNHRSSWITSLPTAIIARRKESSLRGKQPSILGFLHRAW